MQSKFEFSKSRRILSKIPSSSGVYLFWGQGRVIYVGKAVNLKNRLSSYLSISLAPKTQALIREATQLSFIKVESEIDALLLESALIKKYQPKYNFAAKDDKHPLYIRITKETYPRVITARKIAESEANISFYGPFPSSFAVRSVLKLLRRVFPYCDHKISKKPCLHSHIGLCDPCPAAIERQTDPQIKKRLKKVYLQNIKRLKWVLDRKSLRVEKELISQMVRFSQKEKYEEAKKFRDQLLQLYYITQKPIPAIEFLKNPNLTADLRRKEKDSLKGLLKRYLTIDALNRIECFDVAHLVGTNPTASMVTFVNGEAEKSFYRRFRIFQKKPKSDVHSLHEVARRRIKHLDDWGRPDLIIVDGGKPQVGVFRNWFLPQGIAVIGIAKRTETLVIPIKKMGTNTFKEIRLNPGPAFSLVTRIRDEAHRFSRSYHHLLVKKTIEGQIS
jgi:excinuclease ABC subunit C